MESENQDSKEKIYKIERRTYELLRKLEEYKRRNDEIEETACKTLENTVYQAELLDRVSQCHGDGVVENRKNLEVSQLEKRDIQGVIDVLVDNGKAFKADLKQYENEVLSKLKVLESVKTGFEESIEKTEFE